MRKMISFKIENLPEKQQQIIDTWADGQANIQQSLANLVLHVVEFAGNADVMDFDVQRKLHTIFVNKDVHPDINQDEQATPGKQNIQKQQVAPGNDLHSKANEFFDDEK